MAIEPASLSFEDLLALEGDDDTCVRQLIEGTVVVTPSPSSRHQMVLAELSRVLGNHVKAHDLGVLMFAPMDVVLRAERPGIVLQPDLLFVTRERRGIVTRSHVAAAPDLVVEILSPSNARLDTGYKKAVYAAYGVREYWIVPSDFDRVEVLKLAEAGTFAKPEVFEPGETLRSDLFPGLALPVAELFPA